MTTIERDLRWTSRRPAWVTPPEYFTPERYSVDVVDQAAARAFVELHHYSGSFPAARLSVGLFGPRTELVGVAVFSVPMNQHVLPKYTGQDPADGAELGRFVCAPSVLFNGESWFLARALRLLREEKQARAVVSYADPDTRGGKRAHWGTIYQASNATHLGRSEARRILVGPDGRTVSRRTLSKIRRRERGWHGGVGQLVALGCSRPWPGEDLEDWLVRVLVEPDFRLVRHPGNLVYAFGLDRGAKRRIGAGQPYPHEEAA